MLYLTQKIDNKVDFDLMLEASLSQFNINFGYLDIFVLVHLEALVKNKPWPGMAEQGFIIYMLICVRWMCG